MTVRRYKPFKAGGNHYNQQRQQFNTGQHAYGEDWPATSEYVRKRDNYSCRISDLTGGRRRCGYRFPPPFQHLLHAHHIVERSKGGTDHPRNLITVCAVCHGWLHNKPLGKITQKQIYAAQRVV